MDHQTSHELLSHFDRPKVVDCPDFEWVENADEAPGGFVEIVKIAPARWGLADARPQPPVARWKIDDDQPQPPTYTRGAGWVLQWAAAVAVLGFTASVLTEFAYLTSAERSLNMAARAGVVEATLPRATVQSITAVVERRLASYPQLNGQLQLSVLQNDTPVDQRLRVGDGDRIAITLSAPTTSLVPGWLRKLLPWRDRASIDAHAERQTPGRKLRPART
jgi:hypothetical protein